jgi:hypothetical protein
MEHHLDHPMKLLAAVAAIIALHATPQLAAAESGTGLFCLQTAAGARCVFTTMGECEKARGDTPSSQCITRTDAHGTTGLGEPTVRSPGVPTERPSSERARE